MRPILLNGHGRSMTLVKYNKDGDLLFTISKEKSAAVWWADTGERLGTYDGHNGALWDLDVNDDSTLLVTGSGDGSAIIWNVQTGEALAELKHSGPVHCVKLSEGGKLLFTLCKSIRSGEGWELRLYELGDDLRALTALGEDVELEPVQVVTVDANFSCGVWMPLNQGILVGCEDGRLLLFPFVDGRVVSDEEAVRTVRVHKDKIHSIEFNQKKTLFVTASKVSRRMCVRVRACVRACLHVCPSNNLGLHSSFPSTSCFAIQPSLRPPPPRCLSSSAAITTTTTANHFLLCCHHHHCAVAVGLHSPPV
jgi:translation initiation factor 3 subunit I